MKKKCPYCGRFFEAYLERTVYDGEDADEMNSTIHVLPLRKNPNNIVHVTTFSIMAHVVYDHDRNPRIEISEYLKEFPELYGLCLKHEKTHARYGMFTWRHFWLDLKDRFRLRTDLKLREQLHLFQKHAQPKGIKEYVFAVLYSLSNAVIALMLIPVEAAVCVYLFSKKVTSRGP